MRTAAASALFLAQCQDCQECHDFSQKLARIGKVRDSASKRKIESVISLNCFYQNKSGQV
jgi:hypothetical protein